MKKLVLIIGLLSTGPLAYTASAQVVNLALLPVDSTTRRITITQVVEVPGVSKTELYSRAREWFAKTFSSSKAVLEMDDREAGKLVGTFNGPLKLASGVGVGLDMLLWRSIQVDMKDGKYRYTFTNFNIGAPTTPKDDARHAEQYLEPNKFNYDKEGKPKKMAGSIIETIQGRSESLAASLKAAMTKAGGKDW
ncbi:MAG: DUF4468 domain-containing protein [Janthinobacterium lividum]